MSDGNPRGAAQTPILPIDATLGILGTMVGTAVAALLVPESFREAGSLRASGLALAVGLLISPAATVIRAPATAFRVEHILMLGLTYWLVLDLLQGAYDLEGVGRPAVVSAIVAIGVFGVGVWAAAAQSAWRLPSFLEYAARAEFSAGTLFGAVMICAALAALRFAIPCEFDFGLMFRSLAGNRWSAPWGRGALGGWSSFVDHLQYFGYLLPTLTVLLAFRVRSWTNPLVGISVAVSLVLTVFLAHGGSRRIVGVMFGSALICWALSRARTLRLSSLLVPAAWAAVLLAAMQFLLLYRGVGYGEAIGGNASPSRTQYRHLHVDDNFLRLAQVIEIVPDRHPFTYHKVFVWVLIRPIPRAIWKDKPTAPGFDLTETVGKKGVSLSMSALGELYLSFGWPALLIGGWLFGRLASACNRFLTAGDSPVRFLMYATGAMAVFTGLRSLIELVLMSYMLLAWYGVVVLTSTQVHEASKTHQRRKRWE